MLHWQPAELAGTLPGTSMRSLLSRSAWRAKQLRSWLLASSVAGGVLSGTPVLCAADAADGMQQVRRMLLERAKQRYDAGRGTDADARSQLEGALDALLLAYQLSPAPWLLFDLAQVQSQLGSCNEATELYRGFLASEPGPEARASTEQALRLLGPCNSSSPEPPNAALLPSLHSAPALDALSAAAMPVAPPSAGEQPARAGEGARIWPWALAGVAVTAGAAATVFYGEARAARHDLDRAGVGGPHVAEIQDRGESSLALARAFGGVALGVAIAAGVSFWWPREQPDDAAAAALARLAWQPLERGAAAAYWFEF